MYIMHIILALQVSYKYIHPNVNITLHQNNMYFYKYGILFQPRLIRITCTSY